MYHIYILKNQQSDIFYVGQTNNIENRYNQHVTRFGKCTMETLHKTNTRRDAIKIENHIISILVLSGFRLKNKYVPFHVMEVHNLLKNSSLPQAIKQHEERKAAYKTEIEAIEQQRKQVIEKLLELTKIAGFNNKSPHIPIDMWIEAQYLAILRATNNTALAQYPYRKLEYYIRDSLEYWEKIIDGAFEIVKGNSDAKSD